jgi:hypothetical protein
VSFGLKEVSSELMEEVGDCLLRIRDLVALHFRRTRWGMNVVNAGTFVLDSNCGAGESRKAK